MNETNIRQPAWAGSFYPANRDELTSQIKSLATEPVTSSGILRGLIMPHAGYIYSGQTASYGQYDVQRANPKKIILLGPDHHVGMGTNHVCQKEFWRTPLGQVEISDQCKTLLQQPDLFQNNPLSDQKEHSLEVIVPFLQTWLADFELLPIVTGQVNPQQLASAITPLVDPDTLLVISSDLSHFLDDDEARVKDNATVQAILNMDLDHLSINDNKGCGLIGITTLLIIAKTLKWHPRLLHYSNSGDVSGDKSRVVGYATIGFYQEDSDDNN